MRRRWNFSRYVWVEIRTSNVCGRRVGVLDDDEEKEEEEEVVVVVEEGWWWR